MTEYTGWRKWVHERIYLPLHHFTALDINPKHVLPLVAGAFGFRNLRGDRRGWGGRISFGDAETESLFYNAGFYFRLMLPFYVGVGLRWRDGGPGKRSFLQAYAGWKLNGSFSIVLRIQSDASAAAGTTGANFGQATGWNDGTK